ISLSNGASFAPASLLRTASQLAGLPKHEPAVQRLLALLHGGPSRQTEDRKRNPLVTPHKRKPRFDESDCPSSQSDWAELACLRNSWLLGADSCIVAHHQSPPQISLNAFECPLLDGPWPVEFLRDGKPIDLDNEWSCVCWHSDEDADYLELQLDG